MNWSYLFTNIDGHFNWIGVTSIIAILTLGFNTWDRRRQFKADLISKNRIDWINKIRGIMADLNIQLNLIINESEESFFDGFEEKPINNAKKDLELLKLFILDKEKSNLIESIANTRFVIVSVEKEGNNLDLMWFSSELKRTQDELNKAIKAYITSEWNKSKQGK